MKILIATESPILQETLAEVLSDAGHEVIAASEPESLVEDVEGARCVLVEPTLARRAVVRLRDSGFKGRVLVFADADEATLRESMDKSGADGFLPLGDPDSIADRLPAAMAGRKRVLIVDDSKIAGQLLAAELEPKGFEIHVAESVSEATAIVTKPSTRPDMILLDINMPEVDGPSFCRFIKNNPSFGGIKVLLVSGAEKEEVAAHAKACGADGFLLKDDVLGKWVADQLG